MLEVKDLEFAYKKDKPILCGVSFALGPGDVLCLMGPNGTGKTTMLNCLLGLRKPESGKILLDGTDLSGISARKRSKLLAYVPQASALSFAYEVREAVMMGRVSHLNFGASHSRKDQEIVDAALKKLQISHLAKRNFLELSGGEKQMVLVARAMVQQAKYLLMDEPTASLDYGNQIRVLRTVHMLACEGYGILMTTHNPGHAFLACSKAMLMRDGSVVRSGDPDETVTTESLTQLYATPVAVGVTEVFGRCCKTCVPMMEFESGLASAPEDAAMQ